MKRFTDTEKWCDPWFRKLSPKIKLLWSYICDKCDACGAFEIDWELASFMIGERVSQEDLKQFGDRIQPLCSGKFWIVKYIKFQYGKLSRDCKPHSPVFSALEKNGIPIEYVQENGSFSNRVEGYLRKKILERDGHTCVYTGKKLPDDQLEVDHILSRASGGNCDLGNLATIATELNAIKSDLGLQQFCIKANLDFLTICQRLSKATGKPIEAFQVGFDRAKEKKEQVQSSFREGGVGEGEFPRLQEIVEYGSMHGVKPETCRNFFDHHQNNNLWLNQFNRPIDWRNKIVTWATNERQKQVNGHKSADWMKAEYGTREQAEERKRVEIQYLKTLEAKKP